MLLSHIIYPHPVALSVCICKSNPGPSSLPPRMNTRIQFWQVLKNIELRNDLNGNSQLKYTASFHSHFFGSVLQYQRTHLLLYVIDHGQIAPTDSTLCPAVPPVLHWQGRRFRMKVAACVQ